MLTHAKFQGVDTIVAGMSNEGLPTLATHVY